MRVPLGDILEKLGVGFLLGPYQTCPWSHYDGARGITCSAEVRMGGDGKEIEAEAQIMYDAPPAGKPPMQQACYIRATPSGDGGWSPVALRVRGEAYGKDVHDWEGKGCNFFSLIVACLIREEIPEIDDLVEEAFNKKERFADQQGGGGGKSPKIRPAALMNIKKQGF